MWPLCTWQLLLCGTVTVLMLLLGFVYTYIRQKGIKSSSAMSAAVTDKKWPTGDVSSEQQDRDPDSARSDPVKFCSHIQSKIKQTKHRIAQQKIEETMSTEERCMEREIQCRQLEEIYRLMEKQKDTFGVKDVSDIQEQLKIYNQILMPLS